MKLLIRSQASARSYTHLTQIIKEATHGNTDNLVFRQPCLISQQVRKP